MWIPIGCPSRCRRCSIILIVCTWTEVTRACVLALNCNMPIKMVWWRGRCVIVWELAFPCHIITKHFWWKIRWLINVCVRRSLHSVILPISRNNCHTIPIKMRMECIIRRWNLGDEVLKVIAWIRCTNRVCIILIKVLQRSLLIICPLIGILLTGCCWKGNWVWRRRWIIRNVFMTPCRNNELI